MMELECDFLTATDEKKVVMILDQACRNVNVGKSTKKLWQRRFDHLNSFLSVFSLYAWCYIVLVCRSHDALE